MALYVSFQYFQCETTSNDIFLSFVSVPKKESTSKPQATPSTPSTPSTPGGRPRRTAKSIYKRDSIESPQKDHPKPSEKSAHSKTKSLSFSETEKDEEPKIKRPREQSANPKRKSLSSTETEKDEEPKTKRPRGRPRKSVQDTNANTTSEDIAVSPSSGQIQKPDVTSPIKVEPPDQDADESNKMEGAAKPRALCPPEFKGVALVPIGDSQVQLVTLPASDSGVQNSTETPELETDSTEDPPQDSEPHSEPESSPAKNVPSGDSSKPTSVSSPEKPEGSISAEEDPKSKSPEGEKGKSKSDVSRAETPKNAKEKPEEVDTTTKKDSGAGGIGKFMILSVESPRKAKEKKKEREYTCNICKVYLQGKEALQEHRATVHGAYVTTESGETKLRYPCEYCEKYYLTFQEMVSHRRIHVERHLCSYCGQGFNKRSAMTNHISYVHEGAHKCTSCRVGFKKEEELKEHMEKLGCNNEQTCSQCGKVYATKARLRQHMNYQHGKKEDCDICGQSISRAFLKVHRQHHLGVKQFQCGICGKRFVTAGLLKGHQNVHSNQRKFQCSICEQQFDLLSQAKVHARIHTGERPYICELCGEAYARAAGLNRHMMSHTGEKPHICDVCGKSYADKSKCLKHMQRHHPEHRPFPCHICKETFYTKPEMDEHAVLHISQPIVEVDNEVVAGHDDTALQVAIDSIDSHITIMTVDASVLAQGIEVTS